MAEGIRFATASTHALELVPGNDVGRGRPLVLVEFEDLQLDSNWSAPVYGELNE